MALSKSLQIYQLVTQQRNIPPDMFTAWQDSGSWYGCFYYEDQGMRWMEVVKLVGSNHLQMIALEVVEAHNC